MDELQLKGVSHLEIKDAETGEVEAIVATLDVVDKDRDVVRAGSIRNGAKVKMSSYGHGLIFGDVPVGKGALMIEDGKAVFRGRVFLSTTRGREAFEVLKEMGPDQEWSFGFRVKAWEPPDDVWREKGALRILTKLEAFEVSPVLEGAGRGTRTLAVKEAKAGDESLTDRMSAVHEALYARNRAIPDGDTETAHWWAREVFDDYVIVEAGPQLFRVEYAVDDEGKVTLGEATEVEIVYQAVEEKSAEAVEPSADTSVEVVVPPPEDPQAKAAREAAELALREAEEAKRKEADLAAETEKKTKAKAAAAIEEYERVRRTLRRLRVG